MVMTLEQQWTGNVGEGESDVAWAHVSSHCPFLTVFHPRCGGALSPLSTTPPHFAQDGHRVFPPDFRLFPLLTLAWQDRLPDLSRSSQATSREEILGLLSSQLVAVPRSGHHPFFQLMTLHELIQAPFRTGTMTPWIDLQYPRDMAGVGLRTVLDCPSPSQDDQ